MSNLVKLPSGMILNTDHVLFFGKDNKNIGQYIVFMRNSETAPMIDGTDMDALQFNEYIKDLKAPPTSTSIEVPKK